VPVSACAFCGQSLSPRGKVEFRSRVIQVILILAFIGMMIALALLG
jgi:hypothetical protein